MQLSQVSNSAVFGSALILNGSRAFAVSSSSSLERFTRIFVQSKLKMKLNKAQVKIIDLFRPFRVFYNRGELTKYNYGNKLIILNNIVAQMQEFMTNVQERVIYFKPDGIIDSKFTSSKEVSIK